MRSIATALALLLIVACDRSSPNPASTEAPAPTRSVPAPIASPAREPGQRAGDLEVHEVVTGGAAPGDRLPLIVAIHGLGDDPRSFSSVLADFRPRARVAFPRGPEPWGDGWSWFAFRPDMTEDELAAGLRKATDRLARAIDDLARKRPTDGAPIITGFSQGGMLSFAIAAQRPSLVRAAFPVGGLLPPSLYPSSGPARPPRVVAFHGEADNVVPVGPARRTIQALVASGYTARLETFPGVGHSVPPEMRRRVMASIEETLAPASRKADPAR